MDEKQHYSYGFMLTIGHDRPTLKIWQSEKGYGTPVTYQNMGKSLWIYMGTRNPRAYNAQVLSQEWLQTLPDKLSNLSDLPGICAFAVINDQDGGIVFCDRLGIQSVYYQEFPDNTLVISTHLMWLLLETNHDGCVKEEGVLTHFGFGYTIDANQELYQGVKKLPPAGYLRWKSGARETGTYWAPPAMEQSPSANTVPLAASALYQAINTRIVGDPAFLGLTSGKDSLCLIATLGEGAKGYISGTYGMPYSDDHLQAESLSRSLGWQHTRQTVCSDKLIQKYARFIALHTAGLTTSSYIDMAHFIDKSIPVNSIFVMGEAGECIRDFFHFGEGDPIDTLIAKYTTPSEILKQSLSPNYKSLLLDYPQNIVQNAREVANQPDSASFSVHFYRYQRMFGNFSLRHSLISSLRPKLTPFVDGRFIDTTYNLHTQYYKDSRIHRGIIAHSNPALLPFFDDPKVGQESTQAWYNRWQSGTGEIVLSILRQSLSKCEDVFDVEKTIMLCRANQKRPSRAIYYLLRVLTFALGRQILQQEANAYRDEINSQTILLELPEKP